MTGIEVDVQLLKEVMIDEVFKALGVSTAGWARRRLGPIFATATERFARLGVGFDQQVAEFGFCRAAQWVLTNFVREVTTAGGEDIPDRGSLLVVSNHPGTYDALVIASRLRRDDLKIIIGDIPFLCNLPRAKQHFLSLTEDMHMRMGVVRTGIRHLLEGGALLVFPSGRIDPDPAVWSEAPRHLESWSPSVELFLRKVPQTRLLITMVSGVLSAKWARSPITWLRKEGLDRRRLAEFSQVIQQLLSPGRLLLSPSISFAPLMTTADLYGGEGLLQTVVSRAQSLLSKHMAWVMPKQSNVTPP
ncbi:MAG: 1-acyl-sn-glycerol-3-phosphate acyltransferase [Chloroflexota bacterium]